MIDQNMNIKIKWINGTKRTIELTDAMIIENDAPKRNTFYRFESKFINNLLIISCHLFKAYFLSRMSSVV